MKTSTLEAALLLQLRLAGLPEPAREVVFARPRRWRLDLCWPAHQVAVEIQGGVWTGGRHSRGAGMESDCEKYSEAALRGWLLLLVTGHMIRDGLALRLVERALRRTR